MGKYDSKKPRTRRKADELEKSYRGLYSAPKNKRKKKEESAARRTTIIIACVSIIVLFIIGLVACVSLFKDKGNVIVEGVYVAGVNVSGMTKDEAIEAVSEVAKDTYGHKEMAVTVSDHSISIPKEAVQSLDVEAAINAAVEYGNTGTNKEQQAQRNEAKLNRYVLDLTPYMKPDEILIREKVAELGELCNSNSSMRNHEYRIEGEMPSDSDIQAGNHLQKLIITVGTPGIGLDTEELYKQIINAYNQNQFTVVAHYSHITPKALDFEAILSKYYVPPVNASLNSSDNTPIPSKFGYGFHVEDAQSMLASADPGSTVVIPFVQLQPEITTESLSDHFYKDVLVTYTTTENNSSEDRNTNLKLACEAIDGYILYPGETFSYNEVLGERTSSRGYKPGPSYAGGKEVTTIGGGICQVSSTLYYCTVIANLEIIERDSHGFKPAYSTPGTDAMVSWNTSDFRFRNTTNYPIQITAVAENGTVTVAIKGTIGDSDLKDNTVKFETEIISEDPCVTRYEAPPEGNPEGYKNGEYMVTPHKGYEVETYRCVYSKDGKLISKKKIAESSYNRQDGVICEIPDAPETPDSDTENQGIGGSGGITISPSGSI